MNTHTDVESASQAPADPSAVVPEPANPRKRKRRGDQAAARASTHEHRRDKLLSLHLTASDRQRLIEATQRDGFADVQSRWVRLVMHQTLIGRQWGENFQIDATVPRDDQPYRFRVSDEELREIETHLMLQASGADVWKPGQWLTSVVLAALATNAKVVGWDVMKAA